MRTKVWGLIVVAVFALTLVGPLFSEVVADPHASVALAYSSGGPWGLGTDYLGRPVAPQVIEGGQTLLLAALTSAVISQVLGVGFGLWLAAGSVSNGVVRFLLDAVLVLPFMVVSLAVYTAADYSIAAVVPLAAVLTVPFTSRYYQSMAAPLLRTGFYEQALVAGDSSFVAIIREILPVLKKVIVVDFGFSTISAIYILATVSFLGTTNPEVFLWSAMVSANMPGFVLNPWAVLAPLVAIMAVTVPLNLLIDSLKHDARGDHHR